MEMVAPFGWVYQAGTLSGNALAMAAGLATVNFLCEHPEIYERMEHRSQSLVTGVLDAAREAGVALAANRVGSMFTWFFTDRPVTDWTSAARCDTKRFAAFHGAMLRAGIYLPPSQF